MAPEEMKKLVEKISPSVKKAKENVPILKEIEGEIPKVDEAIEKLAAVGEIGKGELARAENKKASLENRKKALQGQINEELGKAKKQIEIQKNEYTKKIEEQTKQLKVREESILKCKQQMLTLKRVNKDQTNESTSEYNKEIYKVTDKYVKTLIGEKKEIARERTELINDYAEILPKLQQIEDGLTIERLDETLEIIKGFDKEEKPKTEPEAKPKAEPEAKPKAEPEAKPKAEPEAKPKAEPEAKPKAEPEGKPKTEPEAKPKAEPEGKPKTEPEAKPKAEPEAKPKTEPEAKPKAEPDKEPEVPPIPISKGKKLTIEEMNELIDRFSGKEIVIDPKENIAIYRQILSKDSTLECKGELSFDNKREILKNAKELLKQNGYKKEALFATLLSRKLNPIVLNLVMEYGKPEMIVDYINAVAKGDKSLLPFKYSMDLKDASGIDAETFKKLNKQAIIDNKTLGTNFEGTIKNSTLKSIIAKIPGVKKLVQAGQQYLLPKSERQVNHENELDAEYKETLNNAIKAVKERQPVSQNDNEKRGPLFTEEPLEIDVGLDNYAEVLNEIDERLENFKREPVVKESSTTDKKDPLLGEAIETVVNKGEASITYLQKNFKIGYARACGILEEMEKQGIIAPQSDDKNKSRQVLVSKEEYEKTDVETQQPTPKEATYQGIHAHVDIDHKAAQEAAQTAAQNAKEDPTKGITQGE